ncbi:MAG: PIN domain-containing protein [Candidatus Caldarchaeales archaeon]
MRKSLKSYRRRYSIKRILLDSTYLLPIVGVSVSSVEKVLQVLEKLYRSRTIEIYYTEFNILEIIGKLSKIKYDVEVVEAGLNSIVENFKHASPTSRSYLTALKFRSTGFRDLIDLLLYTTSVENNLKMLTRDIDLFEFLRRVEGKKPNTIILEDEFLKTYLL